MASLKKIIDADPHNLEKCPFATQLAHISLGNGEPRPRLYCESIIAFVCSKAGMENLLNKTRSALLPPKAIEYKGNGDDDLYLGDFFYPYQERLRKGRKILFHQIKKYKNQNIEWAIGIHRYSTLKCDGKRLYQGFDLEPRISSTRLKYEDLFQAVRFIEDICECSYRKRHLHKAKFGDLYIEVCMNVFAVNLFKNIFNNAW